MLWRFPSELIVEICGYLDATTIQSVEIAFSSSAKVKASTNVALNKWKAKLKRIGIDELNICWFTGVSEADKDRYWILVNEENEDPFVALNFVWWFDVRIMRNIMDMPAGRYQAAWQVRLHNSQFGREDFVFSVDADQMLELFYEVQIEYPDGRGKETLLEAVRCETILNSLPNDEWILLKSPVFTVPDSFFGITSTSHDNCPKIVIAMFDHRQTLKQTFDIKSAQIEVVQLI